MGDEKASTRYPVVKDRECQYCHQIFTSSSLGRHLDQFLYKKKPDGIHDVGEIRQIRSGITRRQARTSSAKRENRDGGEHSSSGDVGQADTPSSGKDARRRSKQGVRMMFNTPTWHATGVINDIPDPNAPRDDASGSHRPRNSTASGALAIPELASAGADIPNPETTRALELALREVLDNVRAAA